MKYKIDDLVQMNNGPIIDMIVDIDIGQNQYGVIIFMPLKNRGTRYNFNASSYELTSHLMTDEQKLELL